MRFTIVDSLVEGARATDCPGSVFWIVLEKFGFLDYRTSSFEALVSEARRLPAVAIVPNAVVRALRPEQLLRLRELGIPALLEGPLGGALAEVVGLKPSADPAHGAALVEVLDIRMREALENGLAGMSTPSNSGAFTQLSNLAITPRPRRQHPQSKVTSAFAQFNKRAAKALQWSLPQASFADSNPGAGEVLGARATSDTSVRWPLVYRLGSLIVSTFEILNYVLEDYTSSYLQDVYEFSNDRYPVEFVLITLLRQALEGAVAGASASTAGSRQAEAAQAAVFGVRVAPWPRGAQMALCIRHDVDRIPDSRTLSALLTAQASARVGVTAYFLGRTASRHVVKAFADNGAEVAYHAEYLEPSGRRELATIERAGGSRVSGCTVHGNTGFFGWRGVANWEVYKQMGFTYAENLSSMRYLPSRFFKFDDDGITRTYPFIGLPHHFSFERNKTDNFRERLAGAAEGIARNEACMIVLNHPDVHVDELIAFMKSDLPADRIDLTSREIADWWRISHTAESLRYEIVRVDDGRVELELDSRADVPGLTLEVEGHVAVSEVTLSDRAGPDRPGRRLSHALRHVRNALAGNCTRVWFDLPSGSWRLSLACEAEPTDVDQRRPATPAGAA